MVGAPTGTPPPSTIEMGEFGKSPVAGPGAPNWPPESEPRGSSSRDGKSSSKSVVGAGGSRSYATPMGEVEVPLSIKRARYRAAVEVQTESQELMQVGCIGEIMDGVSNSRGLSFAPYLYQKNKTHFRAHKF